MLKIVKIGGNIVDNPVRLSAFLRDFAALEGPKMLVHGGGKIATSVAKALGIETVMVEGRRVTDAETLRVVTMVYNGINKQIVSELQSIGCNAAGLCGADGRLITSRRRAPVRVGGSSDGTDGREVDYGFVGDPAEVNVEVVNKVINNGLALVVAPITMDENGGLLNTNADTVASALATAMAVCRDSAPSVELCSRASQGSLGMTEGADNRGDRREVELVYCFEHQGVMTDVDDPSSVIPRIDRARFEELKAAGIVDRGMIPKLENAFAAVDSGVARVVICAAENLAKPGFGGTTIANGDYRLANGGY